MHVVLNIFWLTFEQAEFSTKLGLVIALCRCKIVESRFFVVDF